MAKQTINLGTNANDGTGDTLRNAFGKASNNFNELYFNVANVTSNLSNLITVVDTTDGDLLFLTSSAFDTANDAYGYANLVLASAQAATQVANTVNGAAANAKAAFDLANNVNTTFFSYYTATNTAINLILNLSGIANTINAILAVVDSNAAAGFDQANAAYQRSELAWAQGNVATSLSLGAIQNVTAAFAFANGVSTNTAASYRVANSSYVVSNAAFSVGNAVYYITNSAYTVTNSAFRVANSAYATLNVVYTYANAAFDKTNSSYNTANAGYSISNAAFGKSNSAYALAAGALPNGNATLDGSLGIAGSLSLNDGFGSIQPVYATRAWVTFTGGSASIFAAKNVSSVTKIGNGIYRISFTTPMPDANYGFTTTGGNSGIGFFWWWYFWVFGPYGNPTRYYLDVSAGNWYNYNFGWGDPEYFSVSVLR